MVFGIGPVETLVLAAILFGGGGMSGVGVPLPPDAGLQAAAPSDCLVYLASHGAGEPDPKSTNHLERLLAEPAIGDLSAELNRLADEALNLLPAREEPVATAMKTLPVLARALLQNPNMLYVSSAAVPPAAPDVHAGFVVAAGEDVEALRKAILDWETLYLGQLGPDRTAEVTKVGTAELRRLPMPPDVPPMVPPVVWGVDGGYVFLTIGTDEAQELVKRLSARGPPPAWLKQLHDDAAVPRPAGIAYVNIAGIMKVVDPLINQLAAFAPVDVRKILNELGVPQIRYVSIVGGLDESVSVAKLLVGHDENAGGALSLLDRTPLTKADFADVPRSADFAFVARCDAAAAYQGILKLVEKIEPRAVDDLRRDLGRAEEQFGLRIEDDLLSAFGDRWALYNAPSEGGSLLTGLCAVATIRDRAKAELVIERIVKLVEQEAGEGRNGRPAVVVRETAVGERTISYLQFLNGPVPVAPAWCLTNDRLIFAMSPQMARVHLSRAADAATLAEAPEVARQLAAGDVISLSYADGRWSASLVYSYVQYLATMGAGALAKETGIQADLSKFPSFTAIEPHLQPSVSVVRRRKTVLSLESYAVGPSFGAALPAIGIAAGLALPQIQSARETARQSTGRNGLRQLTIAAISYATEKNSLLPRAINDADGKPLLSWRVALLPYLDQQALYDRFHLDEPWDSEHNRALIAEMPAVFNHPSVEIPATSGETLFQIPHGKGMLYEGDKTPTEEEVDRLPIGRGQMVLIVTASRNWSVPWTKPEDVELTPETMFGRLLILPGDRMPAAMSDGSVLDLSPMSDQNQLLPMFFPRTAR